MITNETLRKAARTFFQAALSCFIVSLAAVDFSQEGVALKSLIIGAAVSSLSAGIAAIMNLENKKDMGGGEYTFDKWVKAFSGKKIDTDGVGGVQCVDLAKHYCKNVIGISKSYYDAWGNAVQWYTEFEKKKWLTDNFKKLTYSAGIKIHKGDIGIFKTASQYGHIVVCTGKYDKDSFEAYDENYNGTHAGMTKRNFAYTGNRTLLGVLRPRDASNIIIPPKIKAGVYELKNVRGIYNGWGSETKRKKVKDITEDAKKHSTSKKNNAEAFLFAGTKVTIKETKLLPSGNLWARIPSGYICIWEKAEDKLYIKA